MKINLKEVSVFLSAILLAGSYAVAQNPYRWTDELELLKRVDKLPEYRTGSYVEQFSSYDRSHKPNLDSYTDGQYALFLF